MNLIRYGARELYRHLRAFFHPKDWNYWLGLQTHDWNGDKPEPGWATAECDKCGRVKVANF